ncbi:hypothetical protein [Marinobacter nauticus]|uniref:hypothetical protein n=1 Tax=Marinobacter nauticus TaxID=2743 RepID=UPI001C991075|nr:hypothetical protein [Marinobacter nauticus]MBY5961882.1 hypothetical protein [Marinobacter nauticus]
MAYYDFTLTVVNGATADKFVATALFEGGQNAFQSGGPVDRSGNGYPSVTVKSSGASGGSPVDLTGSESVWFQLSELDANFKAVSMRIIGPYIVSEVGVVAP